MDSRDRRELEKMLKSVGVEMSEEKVVNGIFIVDTVTGEEGIDDYVDEVVRSFVECLVERGDGVVAAEEGSEGVVMYNFGLLVRGVAGAPDGKGRLVIDVGSDGRVSSSTRFYVDESVYSTKKVEMVTIMGYNEEDGKACCTYFKFGDKRFCFEIDRVYGVGGKCPFVYEGEDAEDYYEHCLLFGEIISG